MARKLVLDTGPLGVATSAAGDPDRDALRVWLGAMAKAGAVVIIPGIADYKLRRNMLLEGLMGARQGRRQAHRRGPGSGRRLHRRRDGLVDHQARR